MTTHGLVTALVSSSPLPLAAARTTAVYSSYDSVSDVILHIKYTAREGGSGLRDAANQQLLDGINFLVTGDSAPGLHQPFSARHEFPTEFHRFLHPAVTATVQTLRLDLSEHHFPFMFRGRNIELAAMHLFLKLERGFAFQGGECLAFELVREGWCGLLVCVATERQFGGRDALCESLRRAKSGSGHMVRGSE